MESSKIPEGQEVRVGDLVERGVLAISDGYRMRNVELGSSGIPFVRGGDIRGGWIDTDTQDHIRPEFEDRVRLKIAQPGDVAFITKGTVGRVGRLKEGQPRVVFAPQVAHWRVLDPDTLDPGFIYYLLNGPRFQANLYAVKTHGAMVADYVSISQQLGFRLNIPEIKRQRAIAHILGTLDDKIELNRRMNQTLEEMARALFKSWFVDFDPVRAKAEGREVVGMDAETAALLPDEFEDSELGSIPKGWNTGHVGNVALVSSGRRQVDRADERLPSHSVPLVGGAGQIAWTSDYLYDETIVVTGRVGTLGVISRWAGWTWPSDNTLVVMGRTRDWTHIIYQRLKCENLANLNRGSTQPLLTQQDIKKLTIVIPPVNMVAHFDRLAEGFFQRQQRLHDESEVLSKLRNTLLPKLLSGDLRIDDPEKFLEDHLP